MTPLGQSVKYIKIEYYWFIEDFKPDNNSLPTILEKLVIFTISNGISKLGRIWSN
jgi:hypothetical protein